MFFNKIKIMTALMLTLSLTSAAFSQQAQNPSKAPDYVEEKGFKGKVFEIKHRSPAELVQVLRPLGSGFKGATMQFSDEFKTVTVRDFPENLAAMEDALKRLDAPKPARPDIELHIHVLIASNTSMTATEYPGELSDVVKQLQATLSYKNYGLMTSSVQRAKEGGRGIENKGVAESKLLNIPTPQGNPIFYQYEMWPVSVKATDTGKVTMESERFNFSMRVPVSIGSGIQYENVGFNTPVSLREGEKIIVGTTAMGDKGVVVVLTAKVLK